MDITNMMIDKSLYKEFRASNPGQSGQYVPSIELKKTISPKLYLTQTETELYKVTTRIGGKVSARIYADKNSSGVQSCTIKAYVNGVLAASYTQDLPAPGTGRTISCEVPVQPFSTLRITASSAYTDCFVTEASVIGYIVDKPDLYMSEVN